MSTRPGCTQSTTPPLNPLSAASCALLDFAGYMDGKEIPDSRMEKVMVVLGDGKLMPAAEQAIYGHRAAARCSGFDFTYPQDFPLARAVRQDRTVRDRAPLSGRGKSRPHWMRLSPGVWSTPSMAGADLRAKKAEDPRGRADRAAKRLLDMAGAT